METTKELEVGYLTDGNGNPSTMRSMSITSLIASMIFGILTIILPGANAINGLYLTIAFLVAAFCPKALQKFAETKIGG